MPKSRKKADQIPLPTLRIYCEGEKTEPIYINAYLNMQNSQSRKTVVSVERTRKNTPVQLVEVAIAASQSPKSLPKDEFWVVYDRESTAKYSDELHEKARSLAKKNGIKIALSNVCFEYWLLLHLVDTTAPYSSYDDLIKKSLLNKEVKKLCGFDYEKSTRTLFNEIKAFIPLARERSSKLNKSGIAAAGKANAREHRINPYVGVASLLDAIDEFT